MKIDPLAIKHNDCEIIIKWKKFKNNYGIKPGLYCKDHGNVLKWLSQKEYEFLLAQGVEEITNLYETQTQRNKTVS